MAKHLGGPDDDHYATLKVQPIEAIEAWSETWPSNISYHMGEAIAMIARAGTKGQMIRDIEKAIFLLQRAARNLRAADKVDDGVARDGADIS